MEELRDLAVPQKKKPYSGKSARMSEVTRRTDTPAENELQNLISSIRPRVSAKFNERIPIESERVGSAYFPDAIIDDFLILEAEGKGSASADNEKRDEELRKLGKRVIHISNRILHDPDGKEVIYQFIILVVELHSALLKEKADSQMNKMGYCVRNRWRLRLGNSAAK
jgi:very-short-patch-repair endonuclease